jgi:hypothetical protein
VFAGGHCQDRVFADAQDRRELAVESDLEIALVVIRVGQAVDDDPRLVLVRGFGAGGLPLIPGEALAARVGRLVGVSPDSSIPELTFPR